MKRSDVGVNARLAEITILTTRLLLLCCGATEGARRGGFPIPTDSLDAGGMRAAAAAPAFRPAPGIVHASPARAASQTAAAMGIDPSIDHRLADRDHGEWAGHPFADVQANDGERLAAWLAAPETAPPGGEDADAVRHRAAGWLAEMQDAGTTVLAITHPMVIRAILSAAIDLPAAAAMRIDVPPLGRVALSFNRLWRLQALTPG